MPQLRQNIITGSWVVVAPERAKRPSEFIVARQEAPLKDDCVFCPHSENFLKHKIQHYETDTIYVLPNKFPAFVEDPKNCSPRSNKIEGDFYNSKPALGGHDVIVIKDHAQNIYSFDHNHWRDLFTIFKKRYQHFDQLCNSIYTMAIYNQGQESGASILHPHAQIMSSNLVPNLISQELNQCQNRFLSTGLSPFDELIEHEEKFDRRVIAENDYYLAFVQFAARFPFETWIVPKYQLSRFDKISSQQLAALIPVISKVFEKLNRTLKSPPVNFYIHSAPNAIEETSYYRWHIEVTPRLGTFGGYELGGETIIDVMSPEIAADYLNKID